MSNIIGFNNNSKDDDKNRVRKSIGPLLMVLILLFSAFTTVFSSSPLKLVSAQQSSNFGSLPSHPSSLPLGPKPLGFDLSYPPPNIPPAPDQGEIANTKLGNPIITPELLQITLTNNNNSSKVQFLGSINLSKLSITSQTPSSSHVEKEMPKPGTRLDTQTIEAIKSQIANTKLNTSVITPGATLPATTNNNTHQ